MAASLRQVLARADTATDEGGGNPFDEITHGDPEKNEYLRRYMVGILEGRNIAASYNLVVLAVVVVCSVLHFVRAYRDRRKWREQVKELDMSESKGLPSPSPMFEDPDSTPTAKQVEIDLEQHPLLNISSSRPRWRLTRSFAAWLMYQPRPIPMINRQLPSNGTSVFVLTWLGLNIFLHFYRLSLESRFFFLFADRCGYIFIVNLPLLYLLSAKTQPLKVLTGRSYEALNILHRRLGEMMCLEGVVHMVSMLIWRFVLQPDWLLAGNTTREYLLHPLVLEGFGAIVSYELLYFTSLASFRQRWYELFLATHVVLQVLALVFLYFHYETTRPYVAWALTIFLVDRLVWRFTLKSYTTTADVTVLEDGETLLMSANWNIPSTPTSKLQSLFQHNIEKGWAPTDHIFLTVPALGRTHALQAHPFTIASAAPPIPSWTDTHTSEDLARPIHSWLNLLIRSHTGFTSDLLQHTLTHPSTPLTVRLDGPYGSPHALSLLRASSTAILVAGGSGIAVVYPLAEALLLHVHGGNRAKQRVKMIWVIHAASHRDWIPEERLQELVDAGLELVIPEPTARAGRPDVGRMVDGWVEEEEDEAEDRGDVGIVASGPDGMNRAVRNACAAAVGRGRMIRIAVEKFGW